MQELLHEIVMEFQGDTRYAALNLHNLVHTGKEPIGTIECRILHGTTDKDEIIKFVELLSAFFQAAMKNDILYAKTLNLAKGSKPIPNPVFQPLNKLFPARV